MHHIMYQQGWADQNFFTYFHIKINNNNNNTNSLSEMAIIVHLFTPDVYH